MSFDSYRKAQLHLQETRKTITIPQLDKDTCISYLNKVFQVLVREDLHKLWTNKKKKTESEILSNYCQQQERKRTIPNLYKKTVELYNQENSTDFSKDTIRATVDSKAIPYVRLYKEFVNKNAANILEELKNNDNNDNNNDNNNNDNNQDNEDNFIHNTITSQLKTILRPDLSDLEKNIIHQSLLKSQKIITNIMADISTLVLLDLLKRTTGPPVEITSILPECKITKVLPPPLISPPSYDVKKLMASHNNTTKAERRLFELYTFGHLMHLLTATHNSQETSLTDTPGPSNSSSHDSNKDGILNWNLDLQDITNLNLTDMPPGLSTIIQPYVNTYATNLKNIYQGDIVDRLLSRAIMTVLQCRLILPKKDQNKNELKERKSQPKSPKNSFTFKCQIRRHSKRIKRLQQFDNINRPDVLQKEQQILEHLMQSSILNSSTTAQVNVEIPLVDDTDAQMNLDVTLVDDTSAPMEVDAPETIHVNPSYNRLKKIANFVKSILFKKNIDQPLTVEDLKMHAPDMEFNDDEANSVLLLYQFFSPYLLPKVYDDDVDRHPLLNFPLVTVCNHILRSTGNEKFVRRSVPVVRHSKTYSITLDPTRLYLTLCSLKGRVGGTKGGNVQPLHSYGFDVFLPNGDTISNITKSIKFQDELFGAFFDLPTRRRLCAKKTGFIFSNRITITNYGAVRLHSKKEKPIDTDIKPSATNVRRKRKLSEEITMQEKIKSLDASLSTPAEELRKLNNEIDETKMNIMNINKRIESIADTTHDDLEDLPTKDFLIKQRAEKKRQRDDLLRRKLVVLRKISALKTEKKDLFDEFYSTDTTDVSLSSSSTGNEWENGSIFVGCDPGLATMVQATSADVKKVMYYLAINNRYQPLETLVEKVDSDGDEKEMLTLKKYSITSKHLDDQTFSKRHRKGMEFRKRRDHRKSQTQGVLSVKQVEEKLAGSIDVRLYETSLQKIMTNHKLVKESAPVLQDFYCDQKYNQRWKRTAVIYSEKGTHVVIKHHQRQVKEEPGQKLHYFYGKAGRGRNSRIGGFLRRGHGPLLQALGQHSSIFHTDEFRTTKLCCRCHEPIYHPKKANGKLNLGTVICQNPDCKGRQAGMIAESRDTNASMNMIVTGLWQQVTGKLPPSFRRSISSTENDNNNIDKIFQTLISSHPGLVEDGYIMPLC